MSNFEILALDPTTPQIRAPGAGDGYSVPRDMTFASGANLTLSGGTANGVLYLNGSKVATSGSALTFDGTNFVLASGGLLDIDSTNAAVAMRIRQTTAGAGTEFNTTVTENTGVTFDCSDSGGAIARSFIWTAAGSEQMRLTSTGLGIGTTTPAAGVDSTRSYTSSGLAAVVGSPQLCVTNSSNFGYPAGMLFRAPLATGGAVVNNAAVWAEWSATNSAYLGFATTNSGTLAERARITSDGNMVIGGSAAPAEGLLTVFGSNARILVRDNGVPVRVQLDVDTTNTLGRVGTRSNHPFVFTVQDTERMRITSAGELLVGGTTSVQSAAGVITVQTSGGGYFNSFRNDTSIVTGNDFGGLWWYGNDTTSNTPTAHAWVQAVASGTHDPGDNPTDIVFATTPDGTATVAEAGRITQAGSYVLKGGTTTAAAGVGIIFPATQVASANANSLDDYEEGTFTPTLGTGGDTSGMVYTTQVGRYTKVGRVVTVDINIVLSTLGGSAGNAFLYGLPFTIGAASSPVGALYLTAAGAGVVAQSVLGNAGTTYAAVYKSQATLTKADLTNTSEISTTLVYQV